MPDANTPLDNATPVEPASPDLSPPDENEARLIHADESSDFDGIDHAKARETMVDLVTLDHRLRDEGSSLAALLRTLAHTAAGIRIR